MYREKIERNKLIVKAIDDGKTFSEVAEIFGLKAKSTVHFIYMRAKERAKNKVRTYPQGRVANRS